MSDDQETATSPEQSDDPGMGASCVSVEVSNLSLKPYDILVFKFTKELTQCEWNEAGIDIINLLHRLKLKNKIIMLKGYIELSTITPQDLHDANET